MYLFRKSLLFSVVGQRKLAPPGAFSRAVAADLGRRLKNKKGLSLNRLVPLVEHVVSRPRLYRIMGDHPQQAMTLEELAAICEALRVKVSTVVAAAEASLGATPPTTGVQIGSPGQQLSSALTATQQPRRAPRKRSPHTAQE